MIETESRDPHTSLIEPLVPEESISQGIQDVHNWLTDDQGNRLIVSSRVITDETPNNRLATPQNINYTLTCSPTQLSLKKVDTNTSVNTIVPRYGVLDLTLMEVCELVNDHRTLQAATIVSSECYTIPAGLVLHRFVVLKLHRSGRKDIWLRLDRRREDASQVRFMVARGTTKANDKGMLSAIKSRLVGQANRENKKVFPNPSTLKELCRLLGIIIDELVSYRIWPDNCWFFCSLVQQHLGGVFVDGGPNYAPSAPDIRARIFGRVWANEDELTSPGSNMKQHTSSGTKNASGISRDIAQTDPSQFISVAGSKDQSRQQLPPPPSPPSPSLPLVNDGLPSDTEENLLGAPEFEFFPQDHRLDQFYEGPSRDMVSKLCQLNARADLVDAGVKPQIAQAFALAPRIVIMKSVSRAERKRATEFLQLLDSIGIFLGDHIDPRDVEDSIPFRVDAVRLQRALFTKPSVSQHRELARMLENLSFVLSKHKKAKLACIAAEQALIIRRECYKLHPDTDCVPLATLLDRYSGRLHSDNRNEEAIGACKEAADLWGTLSTDDGNIYSEFQADSLQNLGLRFDSLQRFEDAKTAEEQGLMLRRTLYEKDPEQHRKPLLKSLENYIASLKNLGLAEETRAAREEQESLRSPSVSHENRRSRSSLGQTSGIHPSYKDYLRTSLLHGVTKANDSVAQSEHLLTLDHHPNPLSGANSGSPISTQIDVYSTWVPSSELLLVLNECSSDTSMDDSSMKLKVEQALGLARLAVSGSFTKGKRETSVKFRDVIDEIDTLFTATPKWRHHTILLRNELTRLQRVLCIGSPLGQQGDLARFLLNEALALQYHGRGQEAPKLLEEALVIQRECFRLRPGVERPRLAFHLEWHSFCLHAEQRYEEAVEMCEEELRLRRLLYEFDPEESIAPLADVLQNLGVRLNSAQRPEDAKVAEAEGLVLRRILYDAHPELHRENLVTCLKNHGITLNALGLKKESKAVRAEYRQIRALSEDGSIITA